MTTIRQASLILKRGWLSKLKLTEIKRKINNEIEHEAFSTGTARVETPQVETSQVEDLQRPDSTNVEIQDNETKLTEDEADEIEQIIQFMNEEKQNSHL